MMKSNLSFDERSGINQALVGRSITFNSNYNFNDCYIIFHLFIVGQERLLFELSVR